MSKPSSAIMQQATGTTLKSVLENFERTIEENNRAGVNSGMYLTKNVATKHSSVPSICASRRKDHRNESRKTMSNVAILATLDEMTDLTEAISTFDSKSIDCPVHQNAVDKDKPSTTTDDIDEMSISSFHSGSRRASSIISRPISICSDTEGGGGSAASSRSKNSVVARPSARIRELPRDIQIGSCDYDTADDDSSDSDDENEDDERPTHYKSRYW